MEVIRFLEAAGGAAMTDEAYVAAIGSLEIGEAERTALLARDGGTLGKLLGGREIMYCSVLAPEEDVPESPEQLPGQPDGPDPVPGDSPEER